MRAVFTRCFLPLALCLPALLCISCAGDGGEPVPTELPIEPFPGRFQVSDLPTTGDATQGEPIEDASILYGEEEIETDSLGIAEFTFEGHVSFEARIIVDPDEYPTYYVTGRSGDGDPSFFVPIGLETHASLAAMVESLGNSVDSSKGILVVALETPALQRAQEASVTITDETATAFVRENTDVTPGDDDDSADDGSVSVPVSLGNTLELYSQSTVTFANVVPGSQNLTITAPTGDACLAHPGVTPEDDLRSVEIRAGAVTYVRYICN